MATRKLASEDPPDDSSKPPCKWGPLCYRKNPDHLREFSHPHRKVKPTANETKASQRKFSENGDESTTLPPSKKSKLTPVDNPDAVYLQTCYEMPFPEDLFDLWQFCKEVNPDNPREALVPLVNIQLAGPFDALAMEGCLDIEDKKAFNLHCRYFYDPPEFQTVMIDTSNDSHYGFFRDDPHELPVFVAQSQTNRKDAHPWKLVIAGSNLMQVIHSMLKARLKEAKDADDIALYNDALSNVAKVNRNKHFVSYKSKRKARAIGSVIHHVGMVVPYDDKTQVGYRPLPIKNVELRQLMLNVAVAKADKVNFALKPIQELVTLVNFANDECDYGMGLELGLDCFLFGSDRLHSMALFLLENAYGLLKRDKFFEIVRHHIENRSTEIIEYLKSRDKLPVDNDQDTA